MIESFPITPAARTALLELAARTGRPAAELLEAAVEDYRKRLPPVAEVPGVNPADVWEAAAQADAGHLKSHDDVFTREGMR